MDAKFTRFQDMIRSGEFVVLDTETTGLDDAAEICQIAIIGSDGLVLLDQLVKPQRPIPAGAARIHGISNEMVADAPNWGAIQPVVMNLLAGRNVVVYNAEYDMRLMMQSGRADSSTYEVIWHQHAKFWCAMNVFSPIYGEWNDYHGNYRWQKLTTAARYFRVPITNAHSALGDCLMTLGVVQAMVSGGRRDA